MASPPTPPKNEEAQVYGAIWEALREERANQFSRYASMQVVAAALLGFSAVLTTLLPGLHLHGFFGLPAATLLVVSTAFLISCLFDWPPRGPSDWRQKSNGRLAEVKPSGVLEYKNLPLENATATLMVNEAEMVHENMFYVLRRNRVRLQTGALMFIAAMLWLIVGEIVHLIGK